MLATQNPIEQEGTYPLPEAQVDRFMLKVEVGYPAREEERQILDRTSAGHEPMPAIEPVVTGRRRSLRAREVVDEVYVDDKIKEYIVDIVPRDARAGASYKLGPRRPHRVRRLAARHDLPRRSPRSALRASCAGGGYVTPAGREGVAQDVLRHRVILTYEAEAEERDAEDRSSDASSTPSRCRDGLP